MCLEVGLVEGMTMAGSISWGRSNIRLDVIVATLLVISVVLVAAAIALLIIKELVVVIVTVYE